MEFFRIRRDIPFMRHALVFNVVSLVTFLLAVFFLLTKGLHLSIEFTGGTAVEVAYSQPADVPKIRATLEAAKVTDAQVQNYGAASNVLIRLPARQGVKQEDTVKQVMAALCTVQGGQPEYSDATNDKGEAVKRWSRCTAAGTEPVRHLRDEFVGPQVGRELAEDGAKALAFVIAGIMLYLAFRFEWKFSVAAIVANLHDVIIILGFFAFFKWEFSLSVLAAVLAVLGYSVNESVVIFDRIREAFRRFNKMTTHEVIDHAITSTMSRTIITHGCTQMMVLSMLLFGGPTLHYFAVALTIGILFGIYSSVFVAAAIAMWLGVKRSDLVKASSKEIDPNDPNAGAVV